MPKYEKQPKRYTKSRCVRHTALSVEDRNSAAQEFKLAFIFAPPLWIVNDFPYFCADFTQKNIFIIHS
jgi:hypothetical protein